MEENETKFIIKEDVNPNLSPTSIIIKDNEGNDCAWLFTEQNAWIPNAKHMSPSKIKEISDNNASNEFVTLMDIKRIEAHSGLISLSLAPNVEDLDLNSCIILDAMPMEKLKSFQLSYTNQQIYDISRLEPYFSLYDLESELLFQLMPNLEYLCIWYDEVNFDEIFDLKYLTSLKTLKLGNVDEIRGLDKLKNLKDLSIYEVRKINIYDCPQLESLEITVLKEDIDYPNFNHFTNLKSLTIDGYFQIDKPLDISKLKLDFISLDGIKHVPEEVNNIEHVKLKCMNKYNFTRLTNVKHLEFEEMAIDFNKFKSLPNLKKVTLIFCEYIGLPKDYNFECIIERSTKVNTFSEEYLR
jgi:hypothetical protein